MLGWQDIAAIGTGIVAVLALLGVAVNYGTHRRKVEEMTGRQDKADERMDRIESAIEKATSIAGEVALLRQANQASHQLLLTKQDASEKLMTEKLDRVAGEVRSFMQGQASAGLVTTQGPRARKPS